MGVLEFIKSPYYADEKSDGREVAGLIWLRIGTCDGLA